MRSPIAAALLRVRLSALRLDVAVESAGTGARDGAPADPRAVAAAQRLGVSLETHVAQRITSDLVARFELICVMDHRNESELGARFPAARGRIVLLGAIDPIVASDGGIIADPFVAGDAVAAECYDRLDGAVSALADLLAEVHARRAGAPIGRSLVRPQ